MAQNSYKNHCVMSIAVVYAGKGLRIVLITVLMFGRKKSHFFYKRPLVKY